MEDWLEIQKQYDKKFFKQRNDISIESDVYQYLNQYVHAMNCELKEWKENMKTRYQEQIKELENEKLDEKIKKKYSSATFLFCIERLEISKQNDSALLLLWKCF